PDSGACSTSGCRRGLHTSTGLTFRALILGQAADDRLEHLRLDRRRVAHEPSERCGGDHEQARRLRRRHGRAPWPAGDERELAQEVAVREPVDRSAVPLHGRRPVDEHHELVADRALLREVAVGGQVVNGLAGRSGVDPAEIEDLQWGCVTQVEEQAWNIGRNVALTAGWPVSVCGTTVDRQCGSSMQTNFNAAAAVWSGQLDLVISGGVEMMSRVPMGSNRGSMSDAVLARFDIVMQ